MKNPETRVERGPEERETLLPRRRITVIPGEGIGPEIVHAMLRVLTASGAPLEYEFAEMGADVGLPDETVASIRKNGIAIKGPTNTPFGDGHRSLNVRLRETFETFANVRPAVSLAGVPALHKNIDILVVRENLEDLYCGIEADVGTDFASDLRAVVERHAGRIIPADAAIALKIISITNSKRIVRYAFEYARRHDRKRVDCVHKANILKLTDGLFLRLCGEIAKEYPDIAYDPRGIVVDASSMKIVLMAQQLDVLLCPNLYGDILSDLCAATVGGLGVAPGANIGEQVAIFEAVHGTWPDAAGKNLANPVAIIRSSVMLLEHIGETVAARRVIRALEKTLTEGRCITADLKPAYEPVGTREMTDDIVRNLAWLAMELPQ